MAAAPFGRGREREQRGRGRVRERVREFQGVAWHAWRRPGCRGGAASRRWPGRAPACVGHAPVPTGARRKATGGGGEVEMGWAVLLGQVGYQVSAR